MDRSLATSSALRFSRVQSSTPALEHVLVPVVESPRRRPDKQLADHRAGPRTQFVMAEGRYGGVGQHVARGGKADDEGAHQAGALGRMIGCDGDELRADLGGED